MLNILKSYDTWQSLLPYTTNSNGIVIIDKNESTAGESGGGNQNIMQTNLRQICVNGDSNPRPNHCVRYYQILFPIHPTLEVCALFTILSTVYLACLMRNEIE